MRFFPAFTDNYLWLLHTQGQAVVVDPGDAAPVVATLQALGLELSHTLLTHHHADHVGGVLALRERYPSMVVYGPAFEQIEGIDHRLEGSEAIEVLGQRFQVMALPGHTSGHIGYFCANLALESASTPLVFCGDTLFSAGCGRLFEGTPEQMHASLQSLAALPAQTLVCCTHEYTLSNLRFAAAVEPGNPAIAAHTSKVLGLRAKNAPSVPSSIALELQINPFLRTHVPEVVASARGFSATASTFAALRQWKNQF